MDKSVKRALELLFGGSEDPVCAVSRGLKPVWAPDDRARMLLRCLREELVAASETSEPVLPQDGTVLFDTGETQPAFCTIEPLALPGEELYLLRFPETPPRELSPAETRLLLRAQTDLSRNAVSNIMQTLHFSETDEKAGKGVDLQKIIRETENACYELLNSCQHCEEALWYAFDAPSAKENAPQDLYLTLRQFAGQIGKLTAGSLRITDCRMEHGLYARVNPDRFFYALMLMFLGTHGGAAVFNEMTLFAERRDDRICVRLAFSSGEGGLAAFHPPLSRNISITGNEILLDKFCRTFGAELIRGSNPAQPVCTLLLPAADPDTGSLPLASAIGSYDEGSFSPARILLSEIMDAGDFPPRT